MGRMSSRTSDLRQNRFPRSRIQRRTQAGSAWNWNGPGLIVVRPDQAGGISTAVMSMTLTRNGVPSITPPHPRQRAATLSLRIVGMRMPLITNGTP